MIDYVYIAGRKVNIGAGSANNLANLFSVDSINVIIGVNGSGKTWTLIKLAELLSSGALLGDEGSYSIRNANGLVWQQDAKEPPEGQGVVYFTPIPYKRKILPSTRLVDASQLPRHRLQQRQLSLFRGIADDLGAKAELSGIVGYPASIFLKYFFPLFAREDAIYNDPSLRAAISELGRVSAKVGPESESSYQLADHGVWQSRLIELEEAITEGISNLVLNKLGNAPGSKYSPDSMHSIVALAALDKLLRSTKEREGLIQHFIEFYGIASFSALQPSAKETFEKLLQTIRDTEGHLHKLSRSGVPVNITQPNEIEFPISTDETFRRVSSGHIAIELRWENLSSGLLALIEQFARIEMGVRTLRRRGLRDILILIDEGDAFLHLDWQRRYILLLDKFLGRLKQDQSLNCLQATLASHSPILAADLPRSMVESLDGDISEYKTFASPLDDIIFHSFKSNTMGAFAAEKIRSIYTNTKLRTLSEQELALLDEIGDEALRRAMQRPGGNEG